MESTAGLRVAYVPGVTPAKWVGVWSERYPRESIDLVRAGLDAVTDGRADIGLVRLDAVDPYPLLSAIPLYRETTVVVVPKEHLLTAGDEVTVGDLVDEIVLHPLDDVLDWSERPGTAAVQRPATTLDAIELVAAGIGVVIVPQSLARLHHRKDLTYRPLIDAPQSQVSLVWTGEATESIDRFVGIVRGRSAASSRGSREEQPKRTARQKAADRRAAKIAAGTIPPPRKKRPRR